ncbi:hypothetical protein [Floccifex porci]|uniref:hypothetical protein n=1 Tax=Floccifex porci TaxID=2606629 RepID=UPI002A832188|nr:hypothetical protein [Floccifex porci]
MNMVREYRRMEETFDLEIVDNGCEARNVLIIKNNEDTACIEGVYEIVSKTYEENYLILTLKTGDYYSHKNIKTYTLVIEEGKIKLMEDYE